MNFFSSSENKVSRPHLLVSLVAFIGVVAGVLTMRAVSCLYEFCFLYQSVHLHLLLGPFSLFLSSLSYSGRSFPRCMSE